LHLQMKDQIMTFTIFLCDQGMQPLEVSFVPALLFKTFRGFNYLRDRSETRIIHDQSEAFDTDGSLPDVFVAVDP